MATLEDRLTHLEFQFRLLLAAVDTDRRPFDGLVLESNLTEVQRRQIHDLMDETDKSITSGSPMSHHDFEVRVYSIVPERQGDYGFAETIVSTLNQERRWQRVFKHMQANGMNIHETEEG